mgnify:CR=1 FL=1
MELGIIGGLAYIGNQINKTYKIQDKDNYKSQKKHDIDLYYNDSNIKHFNKINNSIENNNMVKKSLDSKKTNIINNSINLINNMSSDYKDMNSQFYEQNVSNLDNLKISENFNNSLSDSNMSFEDQFKTLSFDNDKKPQNVSSNYNHDRTKFNLIERNLAVGSQYSLFDTKTNDMTYGMTDNKDFIHSNMTPHFSKKQMINDYNEQTLTHKVDLFSGSSKNFEPKKEVLKENFSEMQKDVNLVNGMKSNTDVLQSYYQPGKERRNELPFQQDYVGPGLNLPANQSIRPDGGKQEDFRPLPKNTDQLRSADRPKESYEGVIIPGQKGSEGKTIGKVYKRRPEKTMELNPQNMMKSGGEHKKPKSKPNYYLKDNKRKNSRPVIGPAHSDQKMTGKNEQIVNLSNKETHSYDPSNVQYLVKKATDKTCYKLPTTRRESTEDKKHITHPHKFSLSKVKFDPHDLARQTIKQTTIYNEQSGYVEGSEPAHKSYNPRDTARTTKKQLTQFYDQAGYTKGLENSNKSYDPNDITRQTNRETTTFNDQAGYTKGFEKVISFNPNDTTNPTGREDIEHAKQAGYAIPNQHFTISFNPNDATNTTTRESTSFNEQAGYTKGQENFTVSYNPNDTANPTIRQEINKIQSGYAKGQENFTVSYNPNDILDSTIRQEMSYTDQGGYFKGVQNQNTSYNPNDTTNPTIRQDTGFNEQAGYFKGVQNQNTSYDPNNTTNPTIRQETGFTEQAGYFKGVQNQNTSYNPNDSTNPTIRQENSYSQHTGNTNANENFTISYNPNDTTNPTIRQETTHTEYGGNTKAHENFTVSYNPNNLANPTTRQDLDIEQGGYAKGIENSSTAYNPNDILQSTQREDLAYNKDISNTRYEVNRSEAFNPNDLPNSTNRQITTHNNNELNVKHSIDKPNYYNSNDTTRHTIKEETIYPERSGHVMNDVVKPKAFNPLDVPDKTLKDFLINTYDLGIAQGVINKSITFNPRDVPAETLKDMVAYNTHLTNANIEQSTGYLANKQYAPETLRQLYQILRYGGVLGDTGPRTYMAEENMVIDDKKQKSLVLPEPTNRKHDVIPSKNIIGDVDLKNPTNIYREPMVSTDNSQYNNYNLTSKYTAPKLRKEESDRLNPDILSQLNDNPLVNNVIINQIIDDDDNKGC